MSTNWESPRTSQHSQHQSHHPQLPSLADMAQGVPATGRNDSPTLKGFAVRDSGNWSMQSPSKHSSVNSAGTNGLHISSFASSRSSPSARQSVASGEKSPFSGTFFHGPTSTVSEHPPSNLPQINQSFDPNTQRHSNGVDVAASEPRPTSVDVKMNNLALASPMPSTNASQTSLSTGLQRERGINQESARTNGFKSSAPSSATTSLGRRVPGRIAPPISNDERSDWKSQHSENPTKGQPWAFPDPESSPNPNAMKPTKGVPWAFPDPELAARAPATPREHEGSFNHSRSRRGSLGATSVSSSILTSDSRLPAGQMRLDDGAQTPSERPRTSYHERSSMDMADLNHHHHQLQNKQLTGLMADEGDSSLGASPYSRTPELRVSHKLAERKRRSEMKGLFEDLRSHLPNDGRVSKTSKWEILTKAIEYIKALETGQTTQERNAEAYRREAERSFILQREVQDLRDEVARLRQQGPPQPHAPNVGLHYHQTGPRPSSATPRPTLPAPSAPMQGVQYSS
ncbi:MAG: hypothetical protein M1825_006140 [Sarcosagium campestre]|nr:MAG: hypothetical protein M1825_006140 [Sarcosagium campestre]